MKRLIISALFLLFATLAFAQWQINESFDAITTLPAGWTIHDDGDGMMWRNLNNASHAHSGSRAAFCDNYLPNQNADWLITPQIDVVAGDSLHFWTRSWIGTEPLKVYVSTSGTAINNFSHLIANLTSIGTVYQEIHLNLSAFAGQNIHIGFLWNCEDYGILIDDIRIGHPLVVQPELDLPGSVTFVQDTSLSLDFTPYITTTQLPTASISHSGNANVIIDISGLIVNFTAPGWNGTETITFTLHDGTSGLSDSDTLQVIVLPPPAVDLSISQVLSPRDFQYLGLPFTPMARVLNSGDSVFSDVLQLQCTILDSLGTQVYTSTAFLNADIAPDADVTVSLPQSCSLNVTGNYLALFAIQNADGNPTNNQQEMSFTVVERVTQGGPDAFGYHFVDSNDPNGPVYSWIDISATGASTIMYGVPTFSGDDNFSEPIPLGFSFPFYGYTYTEAFVDINGEILLSPNNWYEAYPGQGWDNDGNMFNYMYPIPGYAQMPGLISVYWDDLEAIAGTSDIYFQSFGDAPNRYTIVQWNNLKFLAGAGGSPILKFQVIIHENGEIVMQYHTTATGQAASAVPHTNGRSSTVAIQNSTADIGLCYLREIVQNNNYIGVEPAGNLLHDGLAIRFFSGADTQAPVITHEAPGNTFSGDILLSANVIDFSAIADVTLHYNHGSGWLSTSPASIQGSVYSFSVQNVPIGSDFRYYFSATDALGNSSSLPQNPPAQDFGFTILPTANAQVLIAYSGNQNYTMSELPYYTDLLTGLDMAYDIYDWEEYPSYRIPDQYQAVFCYATTGSQGPKADTLSVALMEYLDGGTITAPRNLFMASDGWASSQHAFPNDSVARKFTAAYLRTHYVASGLGGGTNGLAGPDVFTYESGTILRRTNSPIATPNTEYDVYANSPDCIFYYNACPDTYYDQVMYPEIGATAAFTFQDGPVNGSAYLLNGVCATSLELPIYRAFYFSFDFSQLSDPNDRLEWMTDLVDWFGITPVPNSDPTVPAVATGIHSVYPNPFRADCHITFNTAAKGDVNLSVFNLRGQKVNTLANGEYSKGSHEIIWNGMDSSGKPVASGVYFLRMRAGSHLQTKKITIIN
jgi:hypothetical protein